MGAPLAVHDRGTRASLPLSGKQGRGGGVARECSRICAARYGRRRLRAAAMCGSCEGRRFRWAGTGMDPARHRKACRNHRGRDHRGCAATRNFAIGFSMPAAGPVWTSPACCAMGGAVPPVRRRKSERGLSCRRSSMGKAVSPCRGRRRAGSCFCCTATARTGRISSPLRPCGSRLCPMRFSWHPMRPTPATWAWGINGGRSPICRPMRWRAGRRMRRAPSMTSSRESSRNMI